MKINSIEQFLELAKNPLIRPSIDALSQKLLRAFIDRMKADSVVVDHIVAHFDAVVSSVLPPEVGDDGEARRAGIRAAWISGMETIPETQAKQLTDLLLQSMVET